MLMDGNGNDSAYIAPDKIIEMCYEFSLEKNVDTGKPSKKNKKHSISKITELKKNLQDRRFA